MRPTPGTTRVTQGQQRQLIYFVGNIGGLPYIRMFAPMSEDVIAVSVLKQSGRLGQKSSIQMKSLKRHGKSSLLTSLGNYQSQMVSMLFVS